VIPTINKKTMKASKIELNREKRIKIEFPYNQEIAFLINLKSATKL